MTIFSLHSNGPAYKWMANCPVSQQTWGRMLRLSQGAIHYITSPNSRTAIKALCGGLNIGVTLSSIHKSHMLHSQRHQGTRMQV